MKSFIEDALELAEADFPVFPVVPLQKKPLCQHGHKEATTNRDQIIRWWTETPNANIGLPMGKASNIFGLDIDFADGCDRSLPERLPDTVFTQSPRLGLHAFFRYPEGGIKNGKKLETGLTVRSDGYYFVVPPSELTTGSYRWLKKGLVDGEVLDSPEWILSHQDTKTTSLPRQGERHQHLLARATFYRSKGKDYAYILSSLLNTNQGFVDGPKSEAEVRSILDWVWENVKVEAEAPIVVVPPSFQIENFADIEVDLTRRALVEKLLDPGAMSVLYGDSNCGKTFFAFSLAFSVATGVPFLGRKVSQGAALYLALEGANAVKKRVMAIKKHFQVSEPVPLGLSSTPLNLMTKESADIVIDSAIEVERRFKMPVSLIVIDTVNRALCGGNENASEDMGAFIANVDRIRSETKAHTLLVHHSGKDRQKGARGHSSLRAAVDTEIEVANHTAIVMKQRDMEIGDRIGFKLLPVEIGLDSDGLPVTSCVVEENQQSIQIRNRETVSEVSTAGIALRVLRELVLELNVGAPPDAPGRGPIDRTLWRTRFSEVSDCLPTTMRSQFTRALQKLYELGYVRQRSNSVYLID